MIYFMCVLLGAVIGVVIMGVLLLIYYNEYDEQIFMHELEKQIPSKPNRSGFTGQYTCKECGDAIFGLREGIDLYCPHCGQKQDWSNE